MEKKKHTYGFGLRKGLAVLLFAFFGTAVAQNPYPQYDFTVENADGDVLYYRITSDTAPYTVAVTRCHDSAYHNLLEPIYAFDIGQPGFIYDLFDYDSAITVPAMVTYNGTDYEVTSVDNEAFFMQKDLKSVTLPPSVKTIREKAFHRSGIYRVVMPGVERVGTNYRSLYARMCELMEEQKPYLKDGFLVEDMARALYTNKGYLSKMINSTTGLNFPQLMNSYRIRYALELYKHDTRLKVSELSDMSGFHSTVSFNAAFNLFVGKNPSDWCKEYRDSLTAGKRPSMSEARARSQ